MKKTMARLLALVLVLGMVLTPLQALAAETGGDLPSRENQAEGSLDGTESAGGENSGMDPADPEAGNTDSGGTDSDGTDSNGTDSGGTDSDGTDSDGTDSDGTDSDGTDSDSADPDGPDSLEPDSAETDPTDETMDPEAILFSLDQTSPYPGQDEVIQYEQNYTLQQYLTQDGSWHNIYWTKGVTPPSMTGNGDHCFQIMEEFGYVTYQAPMILGYGYNDLNKNASMGAGRPGGQDNRCYLGAASNMLYWWMAQNRENIAWYVNELQKSDSRLSQLDGLVNLETVDFNALMAPPSLSLENGLYYTQRLDDSSLLRGPFLSNYNNRINGYQMDLVQDFFLNGYKAITDQDGRESVPPNTTEGFRPDEKGGYFYPILGTHRLTERVGYLSYSLYDSSLKSWITSGKGVMLSYQAAKINTAHALTLWGAEYDDTGHLVRVYVTDTDDMQNPAFQGSNLVRGMVSMNVIYDAAGTMYLSNRTDAWEHPGGRINGASILSLGSEIWKEIRSYQGPGPETPVITRQSQGRDYYAGDQADTLYVSADMSSTDREEGGVLTYQWYEAADADGRNPRRLTNQTGPSFKPALSADPGTRYYFCTVTLTHHSMSASTDSEIMAVAVVPESVSIENAETPAASYTESFYNNVLTIRQGTKRTLEAQGNVYDGGTLSFQWYQRNAAGSSEWPLKGETNAQLQIPSENYGRYFYCCKITNERRDVNGRKQATGKCPVLQVVVEPQETAITGVPEVLRIGDVFTPSFTPAIAAGDDGTVTWDLKGPIQKQRDGSYKVTGLGDIQVTLHRTMTSMPGRYPTSIEKSLTVTAQKGIPVVSNVKTYQKLTEDTDPETVRFNFTSNVSGSLQLKEGTVFRTGTHDYTWVFTPANGTLYEAAEGTVSLTVEEGPRTQVTIRADALSRAYDGKPNAGYENLSFSSGWAGTPVITYAERNGTALSGAPTDAGDYRVTIAIPASDPDYSGSLSLNFSISKAELRLETAALKNKTYDQTNSAQVSRLRFSGLQNHETLEKDKDYTVTASYRGANAGKQTADVRVTLMKNVRNYQLKSGTLVLTDQTISPASITISSGTIREKTYDGSAEAQVESVTFSGLLGRDQLKLNRDFTASASFRDLHAGSGKTADLQVALKDSVVNYQLSSDPFALTGQSIQRAELVPTAGTIEKKIYDGNTQAVVTGITFSGLKGQDSLTLGRDFQATGAFRSQDAGSGKTVDVKVVLDPSVTDYSLRTENLVLKEQTIHRAPVLQVVTGLEAKAGEKPQKTLSGEHWTGSVSWQPDHAKFLPGQEYKATVRLTPALNYCFTGETLVDGQTWTLEKLVLTGEKTFILEAEPEPPAPAEDRLDITDTKLAGQSFLWVDGVKTPVTRENGRVYVEASKTARILETYSFKTGASAHESYPTGMEVYEITETEAGRTVRHIPELTDLMLYRGTSIRLKGNKGIRMITGIREDTRSALIKDGLAGFKLLEYGTVCGWGHELPDPDSLTVDHPKAHSAFAYRRGVQDPIFKRTKGEIQYTNVLTGYDLPKCLYDFVLRPYAILEDSQGKTVTVYGGSLVRSIGYVARQNAQVFPAGTPAYNYVHEIINYVDSHQKS